MAPGPLHAFFVRIRARRGHQIAAVAGARKLAVLCWHVLTKEQDYLWARPALVANKMRALQLQAGLPQKKGNQRGPAHAYNVKALRDQELTLISAGRTQLRALRRSLESASAKGRGARARQSGKERMGRLLSISFVEWIFDQWSAGKLM